MAVVSVDEIWNGRSGGADEKAVREYRRVFRVITSDPADGNAVVRTADGLPSRLDFYTDSNGNADTFALAEKIEERQTEDPLVWEVTVSYSSRFYAPSEVKISFASFQKPVWQDIHGGSIRNSAGDHFDPPPERDDARPVLTVTRNEYDFLPKTALTYTNTINTKPFLGFDPGQVKLQSISADRYYENGSFYWKVTYEFHFRAEGWALKILDHGLHELDAGGKKQLITDKFGMPVTHPVPLDGAGHAKPLGQDLAVLAATFLSFDVYTQTDFDALNLALNPETPDQAPAPA